MRAFIFILITLFFVCVQDSFCADILSVKHNGFFTHKVQRGQSLSLISKIYFGDFSRVDNLKTINQLKTDVIHIDQKLKIPKFEIHLSISRGDSLSRLSQEYYCGASKYKRLALVNNIRSPYQLEIGQQLIIPLCKSYFQPKVSRLGTKSPKRKVKVKEQSPELFSEKRSSKVYDQDKTYDLVGVSSKSEEQLENSRLIRKPFVYELDELSYVPKLGHDKERLFAGSPMDFAKSKTYEAAYLKEISKPITSKRDVTPNKVNFVPQSQSDIIDSKPSFSKRKVRRKNRFKSVNDVILDPSLIDKSIRMIRSSKRKKKRKKIVFGRTNTRDRVRNPRKPNKIKVPRARLKSRVAVIAKPVGEVLKPVRTDRKPPEFVEEKMSLFGVSSANDSGSELFANIKESFEKSQVVSAPAKVKRSRTHGVRGLFSSMGKLQGSAGNWDRRDLYSESLRRSISIGVESYMVNPKQSDFGGGKINSASMPVFKASKPLGRGGDISFLTGAWSSQDTDNQIKTTLESKYTFQGFSMSTSELFGHNLALRLELGLIQASNELLYSDSFGFSFSSKDKGLFPFVSTSVRYRMSRDLEFSLSLAHFGGKFNHSSLVSTKSHAPLDLSDTSLGFGLHYRF